MNKYVSLFFFLVSASLYAQPLRDINFAYLYDADQKFTFKLHPVKGERTFTAYYTLQVKDTAGFSNDYSITWEGRNSLIDKTGTPLTLDISGETRTGSGMEGTAIIAGEAAPKYLVAKVINRSANRAWYFYTALDVNYPVNGYLMRNGSLVFEPYVRTTDQVKLSNFDEWVVSYYNASFPTAAPAFSEGQARVSRTMQSDSTFKVRGGETINFPGKGLYLIQKDTNAVEGLSFRVEEDYPQYTKLSNLTGPLVYICTKQEYDRLELANGNKKAFDRVVLSIATDTERARKLMRNYFRRVELANQYFTSYKEGWKTDRGMMYIIFGMPEEVFKFEDKEVWNYDNDLLKGYFTFAKSSSLFDPDNYVLIREDRYKDEWYTMIDLWRNARF